MDDNETYEATIAALREWEALVASPGWQRLMKIADSQVSGRVETIGRTRLHGIEDVFEQEFSKGEISGIVLFQRIPVTAIEQLREDAAETLEKIDHVARNPSGE